MGDGIPRIMILAHAVLTANGVDEAERAFATLALTDLQAARGLAEVLCRAVPPSTSLWVAILEKAEEQGAGAERPKPKPFRWGQRDAADTADKLTARMGWQDMERHGA